MISAGIDAIAREGRSAIAVVDDDPGVLRSLDRLLEIQGFEPKTYLSARALLDEIHEVSPICIISDLAMPELTGLDLQAKLKELDRDYPMVFITGRGDVRACGAAIRNGAVDFLAKPFDRDELHAAIERALEKGQRARYLSALRRNLETLTRRERQVFEHVVQGYLNKQIAADLAITEKTVKVHRARVMKKMNCRSVAQLARMAEQLGIPDAIMSDR